MQRITQDFIAQKCGISKAHLFNILACRKGCSWPVAKKLATISGLEPDFWMDQSDQEFYRAAGRLKTISRLSAIITMPPAEFLSLLKTNIKLPEAEATRICAALGCPPEIWDAPIKDAIQSLENEMEL